MGLYGRPSSSGPVGVTQHDLPRLLQALQDPLLAAQEAAFAVSDRQVQPVDAREKRAVAWHAWSVTQRSWNRPDVVVRQRGEGAVLVGRDQQAGLEQRLEAVADAEDQLLGVAEAAQGVAEEAAELVGEDLAGGHVVAVGEAAGHDEDLVTLQQGRLFAQPVDVDALGDGAGRLEGELRFAVAVGAGARRIRTRGVAIGGKAPWRPGGRLPDEIVLAYRRRPARGRGRAAAPRAPGRFRDKSMRFLDEGGAKP